ncbi:hypothetical protein [Martelella sp. HB161492]|uniref:hypothetical protein n=1 Tax=Martelella sp. HB161492 TaxID=2720726 RepID=UPI001591685E|nr:hypothetical protein [Martelella sp. HB161492]
MSDPWLKFFTTDWRADPALRMCSMAARGLWIELICLMHEATPYGHLLVSGRCPADAQIAVLAGTTPDQVTALLGELETAGVFSRTKDGTIYSRKMARMAKKAATARRNGRRGGNPSLSKDTDNQPSDNPRLKGGDKPQKPEARSQIKNTVPDGTDAGASQPERVDYRDRLWGEGVASLMRQTGLTEARARPLIGKWCRTARDDCRLIFERIVRAEAERIGDPVAWIEQSVRRAAQPPPGQSAPSRSDHLREHNRRVQETLRKRMRQDNGTRDADVIDIDRSDWTVESSA